ncbi:MAG: DUF1275 domain-containing protein [Acetobacteraceae bacterium]|nr:DUF1275 domain-containing protein [Acetobacteraceae bacterium]
MKELASFSGTHRTSAAVRDRGRPELWAQWLPPGLSFVAGFVDTASFVGLFGLFIAHITGNFVVIGASMVHSGPGIIAKVLVIPVFIATIACVRLLAIRLRARKLSVVRTLLSLEAIFLFVFLASGVLLGPFYDADSTFAVLTGMAAAVAMAFQNAAMRDSLGHIHPTTLMTGNITQAVMDLVDLACRVGDKHHRETMRRRTRRLAFSLGAFTLGCLLSASGLLFLGFWCLIFPIGVTIVVAAAPESSTRHAT